MKIFFSLLPKQRCFSCQKLISLFQPICFGCKKNLSLLTPVFQCKACLNGLCPSCKVFPGIQFGAAFKRDSPLKSLLTLFCQGHREDLARTLADLMYEQLKQLSWPNFDLLVPIPGSPFKRVRRGYHPSILLAKELNRLTGIPMKKLIGSSLFAEQKTKLIPSKPILRFRLKVRKVPKVKTILLIDDWISSKSTIKQVHDLLVKDFKGEIYAFAFLEK